MYPYLHSMEKELLSPYPRYGERVDTKPVFQKIMNNSSDGYTEHDNASLPTPQPQVQAFTGQSRAGISFYHDNMNVLMVVGGIVLMAVVAVAFSYYRKRSRSQRNYEDIPEEAISRRKRASRCSQASIYGCVTQNRPIDFVVPNIPNTLPLPTVQSPIDTASLSSSSSSDVPLWTRLALLDSGPTLLGGLNPELYKMAHEPEEEVYFPDGNVGRLWFGLEYDASGEKLLVSLIKVKNLTSRVLGQANCCDPFVRICLTPDDRRYVQSKLKKKTCNPKFDETFVFQIPARTMEERVLRFSVFDSDRGKKHNVIGHVNFPLKELDVTSTEMSVFWRDLEKDGDETITNLGEMLISLCYNQNLERLTVTVCEAKNIRLPDGCDVIDSYAKLTFTLEAKTVKTKKTMVAKKVSEPKYNESFHFRMPQRMVNTASVVIEITVAAGANKDKVLGRIVFGSYMFARGKAVDHWNEAMTAGHKQIRYWHKLT